MTWRVQFGKRGSAFGGWVSKPGYDVRTANPGDMLFDSSAQSYQVVASGNQWIEDCWASSASAGGTVSRSVGLSIGSYSNIALWFDVGVEITFTDGSIPSDSYVRTIQEIIDLRARVSSGTLIFSGYNVPYYNQSQVKPRVTSNWFVFRSQFA